VAGCAGVADGSGVAGMPGSVSFSLSSSFDEVSRSESPLSSPPFDEVSRSESLSSSPDDSSAQANSDAASVSASSNAKTLRARSDMRGGGDDPGLCFHFLLRMFYYRMRKL
jgi:hypothetical protein